MRSRLFCFVHVAKPPCAEEGTHEWDTLQQILKPGQGPPPHGPGTHAGVPRPREKMLWKRRRGRRDGETKWRKR